MTMKVLCEEFSGKKSKKKSKKKSRRVSKISSDYSLVNEEDEDRFYSTRRTLIQSQSCPALFPSPIEHRLPLSSSLETLFSSISTRDDCLCQEIHSHKTECSSTRTDLGYSSGRQNHSFD